MALPALDDKCIRGALICLLEKKRPKPNLIVEELVFHNGNAIADVVAVYGSLHGYEIKGQSDKVSRVEQQSQYYNQSFPKLTLVTTENHLAWAQRNLPRFWGIMLARARGDGVSISHIRKAENNPLFSKERSLLMLWKGEMLETRRLRDGISVGGRDSRASIARKIATTTTKRDVLSLIGASLIEREALRPKGNPR